MDTTALRAQAAIEDRVWSQYLADTGQEPRPFPQMYRDVPAVVRERVEAAVAIAPCNYETIYGGARWCAVHDSSAPCPAELAGSTPLYLP